MALTVHELRNEIREAVGRHSRIESTAFTKEALAAINEALGGDLDSGRLPPKSQMRAEIAAAVEGLDTAVDYDRSFRKAELEAIRSALETETA